MSEAGITRWKLFPLGASARACIWCDAHYAWCFVDASPADNEKLARMEAAVQTLLEVHYLFDATMTTRPQSSRSAWEKTFTGKGYGTRRCEWPKRSSIAQRATSKLYRYRPDMIYSPVGPLHRDPRPECHRRWNI